MGNYTYKKWRKILLSINNEKYPKYTVHARADKNDRSLCINSNKSWWSYIKGHLDYYSKVCKERPLTLRSDGYCLLVASASTSATASASASSLPARGISSWWPLPTKAGCLPLQMDQILMHILINRTRDPTTSAMSSRTSTTCWILKQKRNLVRITVKLSERYEGRRSWITLSPIMCHWHC